MKRLRIVLQYKWFYYGLFISALLFALYQTQKPLTSHYSQEDTSFIGIITYIKHVDSKITIKIRAKENLRGDYYVKDNESFSYEVGDIIEIKGNLSKPTHNTVFNLFDYADYLKSKKESWILHIESIQKIGESKNIMNVIKRNLYRRIETYHSKNYLKVFILGDQSDLNSDIIASYRENGISHLFSISGMHLSFFTGFFLFIFNKIKHLSKVSSLITCLFLLFYMFLVGCSGSVVRACLFFVLRYLFSLFRIKIPISYLFILMVSLILYIRPFFLLDIGFQYSATISYFLIVSHLNHYKNYFIKILIVSILSFFVSMPITLYYFYQVNFLSILYNLVFVPLISLVIFPFSFITLIFPCLDSVFTFFTNIMEKLSIFLLNIPYGKIIFMKPSVWWIILYYFVFYLHLNKNKQKIFLFILIIYLYFYPQIFPQEELCMLDVGQGDSLLIQWEGKRILIDTGGKVSPYTSNTISKNILLPFLKSKGIRSLDYLILTHGDYDHMGEAIYLVNNFKVDKVIFNVGEYNELENDLIEELENKNIKYYKDIKELNIDNNKLYFLNTGTYDNENDNSNVIYFNYYDYEFLLMGDAGIERENDILDKYNLKDIEFLKVGHHGSDTSSSEAFINRINPKYSLISVGENNRYHHPRESVLDILKNSKIYRTDLDGSIEIKLKKNEYKIRTCSP